MSNADFLARWVTKVSLPFTRGAKGVFIRRLVQCRARSTYIGSDMIRHQFPIHLRSEGGLTVTGGKFPIMPSGRAASSMR